jgi:hypothetical protein
VSVDVPDSRGANLQAHLPSDQYRTNDINGEGGEIMTRRMRRWLVAAVTTIMTGILIWMPTIAQAGITATAID